MNNPKSSDKFSEAEIQQRFERAVDLALKTPPMHREPVKKPPTKKTAKAKKA